MEAHWTAQAKQRKPVLVEPAPDGRPGNGQKIWASQFTGAADVAYNLAYLKAVAMGFTKAEVVKAAEKARDGAKQPKKLVWVPNEYLVVGASDKGVVLADQTMMSWVQAARVAGKLSIESNHKEGLLGMMRRIYVQANGARSHIARVGKAIAAL